MNPFAHIACAARTDVGRKRRNNEDAFGVFADAGVFCVADGMGGGDDGEIASAAVVKSVGAFAANCRPPHDAAYSARDVAAGIAAAVNEASAWICSRAADNGLKGCGSTFVGVCLDATAPSEAVALHAGDSRLYRVRGSSIKQITKDHSVAELMGAKDESAVSPRFRGVILRAVGILPSVDVERTPLPLKAGDRIVICSDGLSKMVEDRKIAAIVRGGDSPKAAADALVEAANKAGGVDNVTAVVLFVGRLPAALPAIPMPLPETTADTAGGTDDADTSDTGAGGGARREADTESEPETVATSTSAETETVSDDRSGVRDGSRRIRALRICAAVLAAAVAAAVAALCCVSFVRSANARKSDAEAERRRSVKALAESGASSAATNAAAAVADGRKSAGAPAEPDDGSIVQSIERELELRQSGGDATPSGAEDERKDAEGEPPPETAGEPAAAEPADEDAWESRVLPRLAEACAATNSDAFVRTVRRYPVKSGVEMLQMRFRPLCDESQPVERRRAVAADVTADVQDVSRALRSHFGRRLEQIDAALAEHTTRAEFMGKLAAEREGIAAFMEATEKFVDMDAASAEAQTVCADVMTGVANWFRQGD